MTVAELNALEEFSHVPNTFLNALVSVFIFHRRKPGLIEVV